MREERKQKPNRYDIDMSAKFYPIYKTKKVQSVYTFVATMDSIIDPAILKEAANIVIKRFPIYKSTLKVGWAWHYLQEIDEEVKVFPFDGLILSPIDPKETNGYWFKLYYEENRITMRALHVLSDGAPAMDFMEALALMYQKLRGVEVDLNAVNVQWEGEIDKDEVTDGFVKHYKKIKFKDAKYGELIGSTPNRFKGELAEKYSEISRGVDSKELLLKAKELGVSLTSYITGILAMSIERNNPSKHPVAIMIPVNLRKMFPSNSKQNFVTFVRIEISPNKYKTLKEYIDEAQKQLIEKVTVDKMQQRISSTYKGQTNLFFRITPVFLKKIGFNIARIFMKSRQTMIFSNLGNINLPNTGLNSMEVNINVSKNSRVSLGVISCNGITAISFTSAMKENKEVEMFFNILEEQGVKIKKFK